MVVVVKTSARMKFFWRRAAPVAGNSVDQYEFSSKKNVFNFFPEEKTGIKLTQEKKCR